MELQLTSDPVTQVKDNLAKDGHVDRSEERDRRPTDKELYILRTYFDNNVRLTLPMSELMDFAITSAMRLGEICSIEWEDYSPKEGTIAIHERKHPSKKKSHVVPLIAIKGLDPHKIISRAASSERKIGRIFPYNSDSVSTAFRRACRKLKIKDLHFHDLRHEAIPTLFETGLQPQHVMLISGHSNLQQLSRYTNTRADDVFAYLAKKASS